MRETYTSANKVLVIEDYILKCKFPSDTMFEPFARIYLSTWTSRLWTLQEGMLAKKLLIQFANIAVDFESEWRALLKSQEALLEIHNNVGWPISIRGNFSTNASPLSSLRNLRIAVHERFTSWTTDEPLCLGTLMGVDMEKLLDGSPDRRMKRFWSLLPYIPIYVVFWTGNRLRDIPGFGWAPASFLSSRLHTFPGPHSEATHGDLTDEGLRVLLPGARLTPTRSAHINRRFWLRDKKGEFRYWFHGQLDVEEEKKTSTMMQIVDDKLIGQSSPINLAIITERTLGLNSDSNGHRSAGEEDAFSGVLVEIIREDASTIFVRIVRAGTIYLGSTDVIPAADHAEAMFQSIILGKREQVGNDPNSDVGLVEPAMMTENHEIETSPEAEVPASFPVPPPSGPLEDYVAEFQAPDVVEELGQEQMWCIV
jgi:hypothetical protein